MRAEFIDDYVLTLNRRLTGPRRTKRDMLTEARDSLMDAAEAFEAAGLDQHRAQLRAVAEFGAPNRIVREYQVELAASCTRRLALLVAVVAVGGILFGDRMWQGSSWATAKPPTGYSILALTVDYAKYAAAAAAVLALLGLRRGARGGADPRWLGRALSVGTLATLTLTTGLGSILSVATVVMWPQALTWPPMIIGATLLVAVGIWQLLEALRCLRAVHAVSGFRMAPAEARPRTG